MAFGIRPEGSGCHVPDLDVTEFSAPRTTARRFGTLDLFQHPPGFDEEEFSRVGEHDSRALLSRKEAGPELCFELLDLRAERRLRDVQSVRGPAEMEVLRDCYEISDLSDASIPA
jgi:hypothetical protein